MAVIAPGEGLTTTQWYVYGIAPLSGSGSTVQPVITQGQKYGSSQLAGPFPTKAAAQQWVNANKSLFGSGKTNVAPPLAPSVAGPSFGGGANAPTGSAPAGAHNIWNELVFAFVGVAALAALAEMNERLGRVLVALMVGFTFMWFLMHSETISGWVNRMVPQTKSGA